MRDVLPSEIPLWERLEAGARRLARLRGYREIRPPLLEETELFIRSVGEVTDIVEKEMFTLQKGDTSLSLRPEGTAGIVRAYVQAGWAKTAPLQRLFTIGPMFRYERPQKGRERQFTQFDVECIGSHDPRVDAEIIDLAASFFEELGLTGLEVRVNSMGDGADRERWRDAVREYVRPQLEQRCDLCRERFERNVLRVLDCKNPTCVELSKGAPAIAQFLSRRERARTSSAAWRCSRASAGAWCATPASCAASTTTRTRSSRCTTRPWARAALCAAAGATTTWSSSSAAPTCPPWASPSASRPR